MTRHGFSAAGLVAASLLLVNTGQASAQHWLGYYPGGLQIWYFGPHPYAYTYQNLHWPAGGGYFTYGLGEGTYKVYQPSTDPNGKYTYTTPKAGVPYEELTARLEVKVPYGDAEVWFEGVRATRGGTTRQFRSPPLASQRGYKYEVMTLWYESGKEVKQKRTVRVRAGDRLTIDFTAREPATETKDGGM